MPIYGEAKNWARVAEQEASLLKDRNFQVQAGVCPRIERSFVRDRHGIFSTVLMQQKAIEKAETTQKLSNIVSVLSNPRQKSPPTREKSSPTGDHSVSNTTLSHHDDHQTMTQPYKVDESLFKRRLTNHLVVQNHLAAKMKEGLYKKLIDTYNQQVKQKSLEKRKVDAFLKHQSLHQTKYFSKFVETELEQKERERQYYSFENERFNNSDYTLVRDSRSLQVVKDLIIKERLPFSHNGVVDFNNTLPRPAFVTEKSGPNEKRFELADNYDKSMYLSKVSKPKLVCSFTEQTHRESDRLIEKAGNPLLDLKSKND